jgi:hypothetical protein
MDRILLVLTMIVALVGCFGGDNVTNPSKVMCFSDGQTVAEYYVKSIVWRDDSGFHFDLPDGTAVNVQADCIVEEIK